MEERKSKESAAADKKGKWREEREQFIKAVRNSKKIKQLEDVEKEAVGDDKILV